MAPIHVIIIGAGVGGLVLGIGIPLSVEQIQVTNIILWKALRQYNINVTILEQSDRMSEVGAGIQLVSSFTSKDSMRITFMIVAP